MLVVVLVAAILVGIAVAAMLYLVCAHAGRLDDVAGRS